MTKENITNFDNIIVLHEDKYTKKECSLIIVHMINKLKDSDLDIEPSLASIKVYKNKKNFTDSEIDSIIDLRKLLS